MFEIMRIIQLELRCCREHCIAVRRGADMSLAFPICCTAKRIFPGWVIEVRITKS
jgi:hypothetical protein